MDRQQAQELTDKLDEERKALGIDGIAILAPEHIKAKRIAESLEDVWRNQSSGAEGGW